MLILDDANRDFGCLKLAVEGKEAQRE